MHWIGLDIHLRFSALCVLDSNGQIVEEKAIKAHPREVIKNAMGIPPTM